MPAGGPAPRSQHQGSVSPRGTHARQCANRLHRLDIRSLFALRALRAAGCHPVVGIDAVPMRRKAAMNAGADLVIDPSDGKAKDAAPIAVEKLQLSIKEPAFQVDLVADPQASDPKGKCSRFSATHDNFGKEQEFEGSVSGVIDGKPRSGDFKEEPDHHKKK